MFSTDDIKNRLQKLNVNKSPGPDGIHSRILLETANEIAYPLKLMFESSFNAKTKLIAFRMEICKYHPFT